MALELESALPALKGWWTSFHITLFYEITNTIIMLLTPNQITYMFFLVFFIIVIISLVTGVWARILPHLKYYYTAT